MFLRREVWDDEQGRVVRCNLAYINRGIFQGDNGRVVGYDNAHGFHHRHFMGVVEPVIPFEKPVVAVSSRALFNLDESHGIFEKDGVEACCHYQVKREEIPLEPGVAFGAQLFFSAEPGDVRKALEAGFAALFRWTKVPA